MFLLGYGFFKILIYRPTWYQLFSYLNLPPQKTKVAYEIQIEQMLMDRILHNICNCVYKI